MRRLLITVVLLVAILVAADVGLRTYAEDRVARASASALGLSPVPSVRLRGFPFLVRYLAGSLHDVSLGEGRCTVRGIPLQAMTLRAAEARFSPVALVRGSSSIRLSGVTAAFTAAGSDLEAILRRSGHAVPVRVSGGKVSIDILGQAVTVGLSLSVGSLTVSPPGIPPFQVPLPRLLPNLHYTSLRVVGSEVVVGARVPHLTISL